MKSEEKTYSVGIGVLQNKKIYQLSFLEGNKKEIIDFLNKEIIKKSIDNFLQQKIVINLAYEKGDENLLDVWYTLEELEEIGAIKTIV